MTQSNGSTTGGAPPPSDAADRLTRDAAELVREEIARIRQEVTTTLRRAGVGAVAMSAGVVCGLLALRSAHETVLRGLEAVMTRGWASATLTAAYATAAGALSAWGCARLRMAGATSQEALGHVRRDLPSRT